MNGQVIELITSTGVGGLLALVVFVFYRRDAAMYATSLAELNKQYAALLDRVLDALGSPKK
jgi:hypothetical protein